VANARSKAHLLAAVHELVDRSSSSGITSSSHNNKGTAAAFPPLAYFPSFEIMNDDLRDYRFYDAGACACSACSTCVVGPVDKDYILSFVV
jgi:hypothetical protein